MTNAQQRPRNPNRFDLFRARDYEDGRPATSDYSIKLNISVDMVLELADALANGTIQPEPDYNGVLSIVLWGSGWRGSGAPGKNGGFAPVASGNIQTPKPIWQARQRQQQADPIYPGQPVRVPPGGQGVSNADLQQRDDMTRALTPDELAAVRAYQQQQAAAAPVAPPPAAPAPAPAPRPHPVAGGQWSTAPVPAAPGWKSSGAQLDAAGLPY